MASEGFGTDRWRRAGPHPLAGIFSSRLSRLPRSTSGMASRMDERSNPVAPLGHVAPPTRRWYYVVTTAYLYSHYRGNHMTTYSIREFKARVSEILRDLDDGAEVIITRRGKPCGRLTPVEGPAEGKPALSTLKGSLSHLPDAAYEDFLNVKTLWEPRFPASGEPERSHAG